MHQAAPALDPPVRPLARPLARRAAERRGILTSGWTRGGGLLVALAVLVVVVFASLAYGSKPIPLGTVWDAFWDYDGSLNDHLIVRSSRIPRTIIGLAVGIALGLAGAVMQGVTRNPLADPGILGIEAGASLAVVVGIYSFGISSLTGYVWFAFVGAAVASVVVYGLGSLGRGGATPVKLALAGAALGAAARLVHVGDPAARRGHPRPVPVLGGRLARRSGQRASPSR